MKRKLAYCIFLMLFAIETQAQLNSNGANITLQNGAYLLVVGSLNCTGGTITNDGTIEVNGNFINTGNYSSTLNEDSLIMSSSGIDTLTGGNGIFNYLAINKSSGKDTVRLGASLVVNTKLDFLSGGFTTDPIANPAFSLQSPAGATYNFAPGEEIVGNVTRTGWSNGVATVFNAPNMQVLTNSGVPPTSVTVTMIPQVAGGSPSQNERAVQRKFLFAQTGGSAFTANISFPYAVTELNTNIATHIVPWELISPTWNALQSGVTRDTVNHVVSATNIAASDLAMEWKLADPYYTFNVTAYLRGPWNGTGMNTSLNAAGVLPLTQPYNIAPFNYAGTESVPAIPNANIVDWVLIEHRFPASGLPSGATSATITGRKAGFLLNNGLIVNLDGVTPISFNIAKQGAAFIVVRHRNHLGVMSNAIPSNVAGTFANDYSRLPNCYKAPGSPSSPVVLLAGGATYGLWGGDANRSGTVNAIDVSAIQLAIASSATGYLSTDVNLSNSINATDVSLAKITISSSGSGSTPSIAKSIRTDQPAVQTDIPDGISPEN